MSAAIPPPPHIPLQLFPLGLVVTCEETATDTNADLYMRYINIRNVYHTKILDSI